MQSCYVGIVSRRIVPQQAANDHGNLREAEHLLGRIADEDPELASAVNDHLRTRPEWQSYDVKAPFQTEGFCRKYPGLQIALPGEQERRWKTPETMSVNGLGYSAQLSMVTAFEIADDNDDARLRQNKTYAIEDMGSPVPAGPHPERGWRKPPSRASCRSLSFRSSCSRSKKKKKKKSKKKSKKRAERKQSPSLHSRHNRLAYASDPSPSPRAQRTTGDTASQRIDNNKSQQGLGRATVPARAGLKKPPQEDLKPAAQPRCQASPAPAVVVETVLVQDDDETAARKRNSAPSRPPSRRDTHSVSQSDGYQSSSSSSSSSSSDSSDSDSSSEEEDRRQTMSKKAAWFW